MRFSLFQICKENYRHVFSSFRLMEQSALSKQALAIIEGSGIL